MKIYVLDASVIINFLLEKNALLEKKFVKILKQVKSGKTKLYSSYLLSLEVGNGLRYSLKDKTLASEAFQKFLDLPINFFIFTPAHYSKILKLSYLFNTSFYDISYHFLAKLLNGVFLTCDNKYFKKAKSFKNIELL